MNQSHSIPRHQLVDCLALVENHANTDIVYSFAAPRPTPEVSSLHMKTQRE
jgi:hypothetical protein